MSRFKQGQPKDEAAEDTGPSSTAVTRVVEMVQDDVQPATEDPPAAEAAPAPDVSEASRTVTQPVETARPSVGEHVETVLKAAEDAADRLVEEAQTRAAEIQENAEREASSRLHSAHAAAIRVTEEAEAAQAEALAAAERVRAAAEGDAADLRAEAEQEAAELRADAERDAATFAERTNARHEELLNDTALAEDRLRRLVAGLREVADRLDEVLAPAVVEEAREPARDALRDEEARSLQEVLDPSQTTTDNRIE
jgi:hypothetical protein